MPLAVAGTATYAGALSCEFSLLRHRHHRQQRHAHDSLHRPTLWHGRSSGTETLHRPTSARRRTRHLRRRRRRRRDPLFGCGGISEKLRLVECIWDHIHPTDHISAFEVTKRVAWALRGEGAGLLIKNGGENIAAWQGNLFSASRIVYPDGHLFKVIFDAGPGGANGPSWQDEGVDTR